MTTPSIGESPNSRFLTAEPARRHQRGRLGSALSLSMVSHGAALLLVLGVVSRLPDATSGGQDKPTVVWVTTHGAGNRGGGGGDTSPEPPSRMEAPGRDRATVAVRPSLSPDPRPLDNTPPPATLAVPAVPMASGIDQSIGAISNLPSMPSDSLGPGTRGAGGPGKGGNGPDSGSGLGPDTGCCDTIFTAGVDIVGPRLISEVRPTYTTEAMRARIQGVVVLEAVVMPDGSVGTVEIVRSLDPAFGLDKEAVRTVKLWRFKPGTRLGKPVPIRVQVDMAFTLR